VLVTLDVELDEVAAPDLAGERVEAHELDAAGLVRSGRALDARQRGLGQRAPQQREVQLGAGAAIGQRLAPAADVRSPSHRALELREDLGQRLEGDHPARAAGEPRHRSAVGAEARAAVDRHRALAEHVAQKGDLPALVAAAARGGARRGATQRVVAPRVPEAQDAEHQPLGEDPDRLRGGAHLTRS